MSDELEMRRRRAFYRASHRGTKEMDVLLGRYAEARIADFSPEALTHFERFIALPDPSLQSWIFSGLGFEGGGYEDLVGEIRTFHGLTARTEG